MTELDLNFRDACFDDEYMYFSACDFNGLFRLKRGEEYAEWLGSFPGELFRQKYLHYKNVKYHKTILFIPFSGHGIHIYNLETNHLEFYPIRYEEELSFSNAIESDGKIYLIPLNIRTPFMIYDIEKKSVRTDDNFWKIIGNSCTLTENFFVGGFGAVLANKTIYITVVGLDIIVAYDTISQNIRLIKAPIKPRSINYIPPFFYFTVLDSSKIMQCGVEMNTIREIDSVSDIPQTCLFTSVIGYRNKLFLMPGGRCTDVTELSHEEEIRINRFSLTEPGEILLEKELYKNYLQMENLLLLLPRCGTGITSFDLDQKTVARYKVKCDPACTEQYRLLLKYDGICFEGVETCNLNEYLDFVMNDSNDILWRFANVK